MTSSRVSARVLLAWTVVAPVFGIALLPFGPTLGDAAAQRADDECAPTLAIPPLRVWETTYTHAFVSINGLLSFGSCVTAYVPQPFPVLNNAMLAPYWADVDTRGLPPAAQPDDPAEPDNVFYRAVTGAGLATDPALPTVAAAVPAAFPSAAGFAPTSLIVVTWFRVRVYPYNNAATSAEENSFQLAVAYNATHTYAVFRYGGLQWAYGTASDGVYANAGFNAGDATRYVALPGSFTPDVMSMGSSTNYNHGAAGQYVFSLTSFVQPHVCDDAPTGANANPTFSGVDLAFYSFTEQQVSCLVACRGVRWVAPRAFRCFGGPDPQAVTTIAAVVAANANLGPGNQVAVDVYAWPCWPQVAYASGHGRSRSGNATTQMLALRDSLGAYVSVVGRVWLDVELTPAGGCNAHCRWPSPANTALACGWLGDFVDAARVTFGTGRVGIYANPTTLTAIVGDDCMSPGGVDVASLPLWAVRWDNVPTLDSVPGAIAKQFTSTDDTAHPGSTAPACGTMTGGRDLDVAPAFSGVSAVMPSPPLPVVIPVGGVGAADLDGAPALTGMLGPALAQLLGISAGRVTLGYTYDAGDADPGADADAAPPGGARRLASASAAYVFAYVSTSAADPLNYVAARLTQANASAVAGGADAPPQTSQALATAFATFNAAFATSFPAAAASGGGVTGLALAVAPAATAAPSSATPPASSANTGAVIGGAVAGGAVVLIAIAVATAVVCRRRRAAASSGKPPVTVGAPDGAAAAAAAMTMPPAPTGAALPVPPPAGPPPPSPLSVAPAGPPIIVADGAAFAYYRNPAPHPAAVRVGYHATPVPGSQSAAGGKALPAGSGGPPPGKAS